MNWDRALAVFLVIVGLVSCAKEEAQEDTFVQIPQYVIVMENPETGEVFYATLDSSSKLDKAGLEKALDSGTLQFQPIPSQSVVDEEAGYKNVGAESGLVFIKDPTQFNSPDQLDEGEVADNGTDLWSDSSTAAFSIGINLGLQLGINAQNQTSYGFNQDQFWGHGNGCCNLGFSSLPSYWGNQYQFSHVYPKSHCGSVNFFGNQGQFQNQQYYQPQFQNQQYFQPQLQNQQYFQPQLQNQQYYQPQFQNQQYFQPQLQNQYYSANCGNLAQFPNLNYQWSYQPAQFLAPGTCGHSTQFSNPCGLSAANNQKSGLFLYFGLGFNQVYQGSNSAHFGNVCNVYENWWGQSPQSTASALD